MKFLSIPYFLPVVAYSASDRPQVKAEKIFKFQEDARLQGYRPHMFTAKESDIIGPLAVRLKGRVRIVLDGGNVLQADKAEYHLDTGEINAEGHVRVVIRPEVSSRGWSQFGIK
jgi:lipopolysaccharide assembly outer membrane protein LptD (OstA)